MNGLNPVCKLVFLRLIFRDLPFKHSLFPTSTQLCSVHLSNWWEKVFMLGYSSRLQAIERIPETIAFGCHLNLTYKLKNSHWDYLIDCPCAVHNKYLYRLLLVVSATASEKTWPIQSSFSMCLCAGPFFIAYPCQVSRPRHYEHSK